MSDGLFADAGFSGVFQSMQWFSLNAHSLPSVPLGFLNL